MFRNGRGMMLALCVGMLFGAEGVAQAACDAAGPAWNDGMCAGAPILLARDGGRDSGGGGGRSESRDVREIKEIRTDSGGRDRSRPDSAERASGRTQRDDAPVDRTDVSGHPRGDAEPGETRGVIKGHPRGEPESSQVRQDGVVPV